MLCKAAARNRKGKIGLPVAIGQLSVGHRMSVIEPARLVGRLLEKSLLISTTRNCRLPVVDALHQSPSKHNEMILMTAVVKNFQLIKLLYEKIKMYQKFLFLLISPFLLAIRLLSRDY